MFKILYVHGLGGGANSTTAQNLQKYLGSNYEIFAPEIPQNPTDAVNYLNDICKDYDVVVGSSLGAFYVLMLGSGIRRVIINPAIHASDYINQFIGCGVYDYFRPRLDGVNQFTIDQNYLNQLYDMEYELLHNYIDSEFNYSTRCLVSKADELLTDNNFNECVKLFGENKVTEIYCGHRVDEESVRDYAVHQVKELAENFQSARGYLG